MDTSLNLPTHHAVQSTPTPVLDRSVTTKVAPIDAKDIATTRLVLSRFSSGLFRAMFAMKEIENGKEIHRRVSA